MLGNLINRHDAARLNHFGHLGEIMRLIARALRPGGLLIMDEYVGPSRFQWTSTRLRAANALLAALPEPHRILPDGRIKRRVVRPSRLAMRLDNPSEAAESSDLMPALHRRFTILEEHPYGSILHLALRGIACNFLAGDPDTARAVQACLTAEERALPRLGADFVCAVCSPRVELGTGLEAGHVTATRARAPARLGYDAT